VARYKKDILCAKPKRPVFVIVPCLKRLSAYVDRERRFDAPSCANVGARLASPYGPSKTALSPHMPFRQRTASGTRKMLALERLWHQKSADTRKALVLHLG
jgi:hypothetical protein